jgi:uncharacterized protein YlaI
VSAQPIPPPLLWCGKCERIKANFLFTPSQRQHKNDKSRRCMECEHREDAATRSRLRIKSVGGKWKSHDDLFPYVRR